MNRVEQKDFQNYILLSDLDGTLLNDKKEVSKGNREAIHQFVALGGQFGVATGRTYENALPYLEGIPMNGLSIFLNGSVLLELNKKQCLRTFELKKKESLRILRLIYVYFPEIMIQLYTTNGMYVISELGEGMEEVLENHKPWKVGNLKDLMEVPWLKILLAHKETTVLETLKKVAKREGLFFDIDAVFSSPIFLELLPKGVSKGSMLVELRQWISYRNGGRKVQICAIGDYDNDITMIKESDIGFAVGNGVEKVKKIADFITVTNNEDAIAEVIEQLLRGRGK